MRRKPHSQWQREQESGEPMPRDPSENKLSVEDVLDETTISRRRLLKENEHLLEQIEQMEDNVVRRHLLERAAINAICVALTLDDEGEDLSDTALYSDV